SRVHEILEGRGIGPLLMGTSAPSLVRAIMLSTPAPELITVAILSATSSRGVRWLKVRLWLGAGRGGWLPKGGADLPFWRRCDQPGQFISRVTSGEPVTHVALLWQPRQVQNSYSCCDILQGKSDKVRMLPPDSVVVGY